MKLLRPSRFKEGVFSLGEKKFLSNLLVKLKHKLQKKKASYNILLVISLC